MNKSVFVFLLLCAIATHFADISISSYSVLPTTVRPGITGSISITILNSGSNATSVTAEPAGSQFIISSGRYNLGDFSSGITTSFSIPFTVSKNTPPGIYNLPIYLTYFSTGQSGFLSGKKTLIVPISVKNPASFQLESQPAIAYADSGFTSEVTIRNSGGTAYDAKLYSNSTSFYIAGPTPVFLGTVEDNVVFSLNLTMASGIPSGRYSVPLVITYRDALGTDYSETLFLNAEVRNRLPKFIFSVVPASPLVPGKASVLSLRLKNSGDMAAYSVSVKLQSPNILTPLSTSEIIVGDLAPNSEANVFFDVGVKNIEPGFYPLTAEIYYKDGNGNLQAPYNVSVGVNVAAPNELSVFVSSKPIPITAGQAHTFSVLVSNTGSSRIKALRLRLIESPVFKILDAQASQFIGGLEQDDFSSVQYKVLVGNVPPGSYPLIVESSFKDAYNNEYTINSTVMLEVVSSETASKVSGQSGDSSILCIGAAAIAALLALVLYFKFRGKGKTLTFFEI
ncbi:MAG: hypothetical protein QXG33_04340 [Candidatus Anstonellales archaeon]